MYTDNININFYDFIISLYDRRSGIFSNEIFL